MSKEARALLTRQFLDNCEAIGYLQKSIRNTQVAVAALERDNAVIEEKIKEIEKDL